MAKCSIPGLVKWNTIAGGTSAPPGKHNYDFRLGARTYSISVIASDRGRFRGYQLTVFPSDTSGHGWVGPDGAARAVKAARLHAGCAARP